MISVTNTQNSTALKLLQSSSHLNANSGGSTGTSDPATIVGVVSSRSDTTNSPVTKALAEITRIVLESGGEVIIAGDDANITGTDFDDYIQIGRGSTVNAGDGNDTIVARWGSTVNGGAGDDKIIAYGSIASGSDVNGGDGDDTIFAGGEVYGGAGNDTIQGGGNIYGGEGNDNIHGTDSGGMQNTTISGGKGNDNITAFGAYTTVYGNEGNDTIEMNYGEGTASGGAGDDHITVDGNKDSDRSATIRFDKGDDNDTIVLKDANVTLELGLGLDADKMNVSYNEDGGEVVITFEGNETDQITISNHMSFSASNIVELKFADGHTQEIVLDRGHGDHLGASIEAFLMQTGQLDE